MGQLETGIEGNCSSIFADTHIWFKADEFKDLVSHIDLGTVFFNTCIFRIPLQFRQFRPRNKVRLMQSQMVVKCTVFINI